MNGVVLSDSRFQHADLGTVAAGLDDNTVGLILFSDDSPSNAADGRDLVAFLQVEAGLLLQVLADVSDDALEHTAGTGDRILLLAARSDDAQDHFADLLLIAAAGLGITATGVRRLKNSK